MKPLSETEAAKKWCPFSRVVGGAVASATGMDVRQGSPVFNRVGYSGQEGAGLPSASYCLGQHCMAWEWVKEPVNRQENQTFIIEAGQGRCSLMDRQG